MWSALEKKEFPLEGKFYPLRVEPIEKRDRNDNGKVASPKSRIFYFSTHFQCNINVVWYLIQPDNVSGKLLVREAWDEPTSEFPEGRHGNRSVFYEGRAALLTLTMPNPDTSSLSNIVTETDDNILTRFSELAVCSNFKQVTREEGNNVLETCVAKKPASHLKKRAILSRNRRSGEVHHPSVKSILEQVGRHKILFTNSITLNFLFNFFNSISIK